MKKQEGGKRILFKIKNFLIFQSGEKEFTRDFISPWPSAAEFLIDWGIQLIGIDYLSIETFNALKGNPVHRLLLKNNIIILEGLNLHNIKADTYELICLPLKLTGAEGSPVRAILREV